MMKGQKHTEETKERMSKTQKEKWQNPEYKEIAIHHIDYNKKNNNPLNLISLCNFCNVSVNASREEWTNYFQNKLLEIK